MKNKRPILLFATAMAIAVMSMFFAADELHAAEPARIEVGNANDLFDAIDSRFPVISLTENITYTSPVVINAYAVTFELNGYTLDIVVEIGTAMAVENGSEVKLDNINGGALNIKTTSGGNNALAVVGDSYAMVTNLTTDADEAILAFFNATVVVLGDVTAVRTGMAVGDYSSVTIHGRLTAKGINDITLMGSRHSVVDIRNKGDHDYIEDGFYVYTDGINTVRVAQHIDVPKTGIKNITVAMWVMFAFFGISPALWFFALRRTKKSV